jgi:hypothetical protein
VSILQRYGTLCHMCSFCSHALRESIMQETTELAVKTALSEEVRKGKLGTLWGVKHVQSVDLQT